MNVMYRGLENIGGNPVSVSVPGYSSSDISIRVSGGTYKAGRKKVIFLFFQIQLENV